MPNSQGRDWTEDLATFTIEELIEHKETLRKHQRGFLRIPGVTAVDVGYKIKGLEFPSYAANDKSTLGEEEEIPQTEIAIRIHVERKEHKAVFTRKGSLRVEELIPKNLEGTRGRKIPTDVIQARYLPCSDQQIGQLETFIEKRGADGDELQELRRGRVNPLVGGISIGSPNVAVGTLGAVVWDETDGSACILSNWHVLAGDLNARVGHPCYQPGSFDQGDGSDDEIAQLKRWCFDRNADAALAELTNGRHFCVAEALSIHQPISGVVKKAEIKLGMRVYKSGRTTGFTEGFIDGLFLATNIKYSDQLVHRVEDQIHIAPRFELGEVTERGDSGALWLDADTYKAVGLHFAGDVPSSPFGEFSIANIMDDVATKLKFSFRPLFLSPRNRVRMQKDFRTQLRSSNRRGARAGGRNLQPGEQVGGTSASGPQPVSDPMPSGGG